MITQDFAPADGWESRVNHGRAIRCGAGCADVQARETPVGQVIVVGSVNADYAVRVGHLPQPGETVTGGRLEILPGGKGANQATAAARLGAQVTLVAAVGRDARGDQAMADLLAEGIDAAGLL